MKLNKLILGITLINPLISESVDCQKQCGDQGLSCLAKCYANKLSSTFMDFLNPKSNSTSSNSNNTHNNNTNLGVGFDAFVSSLEKQGSAIQTGISGNNSNLEAQGSNANSYILIPSTYSFVTNSIFNFLTAGFWAIF
ncbi:hypothetical protein CONCODRAFT_4237 [Conidiobolus coronatus NRRL 28638]|uniref:Extracellular membrane protein CFEM domain-containing protein n=1 Tax=Conidiobolus coronatus (strain ATCC 28846 / CBS 209.66 / NRRL 28638) TaxID=796925 RepID=A0A137PCX4_CONC2|nr:hypothetical protein CONCODRAFT_4237 [Conidiobolus coronatus NRRL 28638]|eukprot:KXN72843.1 hypothetical protein CONCODRAFT_4237 [Conidiobolus coronatus NRRL 28638]